MSSPIASNPGLAAPQATAALSGAMSAAPGARVAVSEAAATAAAVSLDTLPASPPQDVLDQMAGAAQTYTALQSQGRELRFMRDERSGRLQIEVRDREGNFLRTLSPAQALDVAAGAPLE